MTNDEAELVNAVVDDTLLYARRMSLSLPVIPWDIHMESHPDELKKVDQLISGMLDRLRNKVSDFYEKSYRVMSNRVDSGCDNSSVLIWYRMLCNIKYVVSVSKRWAGADHPGYLPLPEARAELKRRGLWKK